MNKIRRGSKSIRVKKIDKTKLIASDRFKKLYTVWAEEKELYCMGGNKKTLNLLYLWRSDWKIKIKTLFCYKYIYRLINENNRLGCDVKID